MKNLIAEHDVAELAKKISAFSDAIKSTTNPELLEAYHKIIKKSTTMTTRKYLAAYLLLNGSSFSNSTSSNKRNAKTQNKRFDRPLKPATPKKPVINTTTHKENTKNIFVSAGRNRKVFPKDLISLFSTQLEVDQELFGEVKIFQNFSFIEVPDELCDLAISKINGTEFRKMKLKVNFSKTQSDIEYPKGSSASTDIIAK